MKTVIFEAEPWECPWFEELGETHNVACVEGPLNKETAEANPDAEIISTFIYSTLTAEILDIFDNLKFIATRSTGFDHIDLDYCSENNIKIANVPAYGEHTVAEHVFGLLLTLSHKLDQAVDRTRRGDFSPKGLQGFDLHGKTLGVIGTGDIGKAVIRIAGGFAMKVLAFDVKPEAEAAEKLGFEYADMDRLLSESDIITLHVPENAHTRNMISEEEVGKMKEGAVLINTARGALINMQALVRALAEGKIAAAGLDVLPEEPVIREEAELLRSVYQRKHDLESLLANNVILRLRNVVVTPHSAFNTKEAVHRILDDTAENIRAFIRGEKRNIVN
jgi:D-lactate dehydrogenase